MANRSQTYSLPRFTARTKAQAKFRQFQGVSGCAEPQWLNKMTCERSEMTPLTQIDSRSLVSSKSRCSDNRGGEWNGRGICAAMRPRARLSSEMASTTIMLSWCENPFSHPPVRESGLPLTASAQTEAVKGPAFRRWIDRQLVPPRSARNGWTCSVPWPPCLRGDPLRSGIPEGRSRMAVGFFSAFAGLFTLAGLCSWSSSTRRSDGLPPPPIRLRRIAAVCSCESRRAGISRRRTRDRVARDCAKLRGIAVLLFRPVEQPVDR
jgi:hypothetical protein